MRDFVPAICRDLPRVSELRLPLLSGETPVIHLSRLASRLGRSDLWLKNDAATGKLCGGGKVRKLEFLLGAARSRQASEIVTFGGVGSNHAVATCLYARSIGMNVRLFLSPHPLSAGGIAMTNLQVSHACGARISIVTYPHRVLRERGWQVAGRVRRDGTTVSIPSGGSSPVGCIGYAAAAFELCAQIARGQVPRPATIFVPVGSGGVLAGLHAGFAILESPIELVGVRIARTCATARVVANLSARTMRALGFTAPPASVHPRALPTMRVMSGFYGVGYARPTPASRHAVQLLEETEGIQLENTYTGKAMAAALEYQGRKRGRRGPILFWNTANGVDLRRHLPISDSEHGDHDCGGLPPRIRSRLRRWIHPLHG